MPRPSEQATTGGAPTKTGQLVLWELDRGFGFVHIAGERQNAFLHVTDLEGAKHTPPTLGDLIEFTLIETERGPRAVEARVVKSADQPARR